MLRLHALVFLLVISSGCATTQPEAVAAAPAPEAPHPGAMQIVPLQFAAAGELEKELTRALGSSKEHGLRIVADVRTNSLILTANSGAGLARALELIARLDVPTPKPR